MLPRLHRVGLGTWQTFDARGDSARVARLSAALRAFADAGGQVVDTSPMYGSAEATLGTLMADTGTRGRLFLATKVWITGREAGERQVRQSIALLRSPTIDLMQIHNLVDWRTHLVTLRRMRDQGTVRFIGVTHYAPGAWRELLRVIRAERVDVVQYALSLDEPEAAAALLPECAARGIAFLANRPFGEGSALARVRNTPLPAWAAEFGIVSWAQYLLKWVLAHPEVTCAIPGTSNPQHAVENIAAAGGVIPDRALRERMAAAWRAL